MSTPETISQAQASVTAQAETALSALASTVSVLRSQLDATTQRKNELLERRMALYTAPLNPADIRQCVGELIDLRASSYVEALRKYGWVNKLAEPNRGVGKGNAKLTLEDAESMLGAKLEISQRGDPIGSAWELPILLMHREFEASWPYFILGDLLKERLSAALVEIQGDSARGFVRDDMPSMDERRQEIAAINAELRTLDAEVVRLRSEIRKLSAPVLSSASALKNAAEAA